MRRAAFIFGVGVLAVALGPMALATDNSAGTAPPFTCSNGIPGGVNCILTKKDLKDARKAFALGMKLEQQARLEDAFQEFDHASRMVPQNVQFLQARELVKAQIVFRHVQDGNVLLANNSRAEAAARFRAALDLDPDNQFARDRLAEAVRVPHVDGPPVLPSKLADTGEIHLEPKKDRVSFHFRGDARGLYTELGTSFGIAVQFDDSVQNRQVRFFVDDVDFVTALNLAGRVTKTMWAALDTHQMLVAADNPENHRTFDRMSLRTFAVPPHSTPQEVNDLITTLRNMFTLNFINSGQTGDTIEVRGPQDALEGCATLLKQLSSERPQVMLDIQIFQISHTFTRNIGMHVPNTFNLYNIPAAALVGLAGQNIQQLINQLISSGGINQAGSTALSGLLAQLGGGQSGIFSQPLATFGGGLTFSGLSLDHLSAALSVNESWVRSLSSATMRASQGNDATFHLGERYPIENASYAPIYNSAQISKVLGNQSYVPPFPSVSYEDLGLNIKVKPTVHSDNSVSLQLELEVRALTGASSNGVPVIANREYKGSIGVKDGEPAVVAGEMSKTDSYSMSGIPGLGYLPILNQAMVNNTKEEDFDELLIVIVPHILGNMMRSAPEIWISEK
jgi:general secretion pathway protein D